MANQFISSVARGHCPSPPRPASSVTTTWSRFSCTFQSYEPDCPRAACRSRRGTLRSRACSRRRPRGRWWSCFPPRSSVPADTRGTWTPRAAPPSRTSSTAERRCNGSWPRRSTTHTCCIKNSTSRENSRCESECLCYVFTMNQLNWFWSFAKNICAMHFNLISAINFNLNYITTQISWNSLHVFFLWLITMFY